MGGGSLSVLSLQLLVLLLLLLLLLSSEGLLQSQTVLQSLSRPL